MSFYLILDKREPGFDACFESSLFENASEDLEEVERQLNIKSHLEFFRTPPLQTPYIQFGLLRLEI